MDEKKNENERKPGRWEFLVMENPQPGARERSLKYFRDNPTSITIRDARELRPATKPSKKD
jgi:hypothetical protein